MAGPLGVTHLLLFSHSTSGNTNLRVALTPRGPTLHFKVENYSLCKDISQALKHPRGGGKEHLAAPLLVMNNFAQAVDTSTNPIPKQLESLMTTIFQSFFPPISPQTTPLSSIKRIMLLNREKTSAAADGTYVMNLRHYAITTKRIGVSRRIRRLDPNEQRLKEKKGKAIPNLGKLDDVADYLLDPAAGGYTSASETEVETDAEVEILESTTKKVLNKKDRQRMQESDKPTTHSDRSGGVEKRAVKLVELGPRMKLRLVKVEEGVCEGKVMWHEFVTKTTAEEREMDQVWDERKKQKEQRKKEQKANVERKRQERAASGKKDKGEDEKDDEELEDAWDSEDYEDDFVGDGEGTHDGS